MSRLNPALLGIMVIACAIAAIAPFDIVFSWISFGSPLVRVVLMAAIVYVGGAAASRVGLPLEGKRIERTALIGTAAAVAVAVYVVLLDCYLFRALLDPRYVAFLRQPLDQRFAYFMLRAFNENVIYRLFLFSILTLLLLKVRPRSAGVFIAAMVVAQCVNIGANVASFEQVTGVLLAYDALRYVAPGVLWAWLFWRFGFTTAEIASVGCHLFLQPMFSVLI